MGTALPLALPERSHGGSGPRAAPARCEVGRSPLPGRGPAPARAGALRPVPGQVNAEVRDARGLQRLGRRRAAGARWSGARRRETVGTGPGSGEARATRRRRSRTTVCSRGARPAAFPNTPTGWISGCSCSSTWRCFCSCIFCPGESSECGVEVVSGVETPSSTGGAGGSGKQPRVWGSKASRPVGGGPGGWGWGEACAAERSFPGPSPGVLKEAGFVRLFSDGSGTTPTGSALHCHQGNEKLLRGSKLFPLPIWGQCVVTSQLIGV